MLAWLTKKLLSYVMLRERQGDIRPALKLDRDDVQFDFPGTNSWSGHYDGKAEVRRWQERMVRVGVKTDVDEVAVSGFPWNTTVAVRGRSWWDNARGERIYDNRFVIWGRLRWGKMAAYEVYEDTEKAAALDAYLEAHEPALGAA
jgi:ketosteroid isomerase-like protein